jgi:hypothetical protein
MRHLVEGHHPLDRPELKKDSKTENFAVVLTKHTEQICM